jgi:predicted Fe-Mo cluster-binding NifX family protein
MNICIPVNEDQGQDSPVCAHFGSAPFFMIVDTESGNCRAIRNNNQHHAHGMCTPLASLGGEQIDGMVVGGIGLGALNKLISAGIQVFLSERSTVVETVSAYRAGTLRLVTPETACGHHQGQHHTHDQR